MTTNELKLTIELVPSTVWYSSIYQYCKKSNKLEKWQELKKRLFEKEGRRCWICGQENTRLEAHEFWQYDDAKHVQKLVAIHHLCDLCHKVKHIGLWLHTEQGEEMLAKEHLTKQDVVNHFCAVNKCSKNDFQEYEKQAFDIWNERSKHNWTQDFGEFGVLK